MDMNKHVPLVEAAKRLGMNVHDVRKDLQEGNFNPPIGHATKCSIGYRYYISRKMIENHLSQKKAVSRCVKQ